MTNLAIMAKAPRPGHSKTRLCPPCTFDQAAAIAEAALRDTLDVAVSTAASRVVLVLSGLPLTGLDPAVECHPQRGDGLGERLDRAFADLDEPTLLLGMDTPQVDRVVLDDALERVGRGVPVFGPALDGGWWALGLCARVLGAFDGVPMSEAHTGARQLERLWALGVRPHPLPVLRDVDHWTDAEAVAAACPAGRFGAAVRTVRSGLSVSSGQ